MTESEQEYPITGSDTQVHALNAALRLARTCEYDAQHTHQVTQLALHLFDELTSLHNLGDEERYWLEMAALLHDIGWIEGWKGHHKSSLRIILGTTLLPLSSKERIIIGSIARYHRQALPSKSHDHYSTLRDEEQKKVDILAAMLRLADGLDRGHQNRVKEVKLRTSSKKITLYCTVVSPHEDEEAGFMEKSDLLKKILKRKVIVIWEMNPTEEE